MKIFLSPPYMNGDTERRLLAEAMDSNYIAPCGPMVDALEAEAAKRFNFKRALATISGTMALELLARTLNLQPGDTILVSDLTFIASVGPFVSLGAQPVFIDADPTTWCLDPKLVEEAFRRYPHARALIATDLYGQSCDVDALAALCQTYGAKFIVDAAESVGATYRGRASGKGAWATVYSLNGNKIITSGGGGLLLSDDEALINHCRKLSAQGRENALWYEHKDLGTQGRLGNLPAAVGLGQLRHLDDALRDKARVWQEWVDRLGNKPWCRFMPTAPYGTPNRWLTVITLEGKDPLVAVRMLAERGIEARPVWKPMHQQPLFASTPFIQAGVSDRCFASGLCLPSGRGLQPEVMDEVVSLLEAL